MTPWKVIAFYTNDSLYLEQISNLRGSLEKFNIPYHLEQVENKGSWRDNTLAMNGYILEAFDKHTDNLVFLDADAIVRQYPTLFDTIEEDFACHYKNDIELLAGTMYFKNCEKVKKFVSDWINCSKKKKGGLAAQTSIVDALKLNSLSVYRLPAPYTLIFDSMKDKGPPVIEHFQASRKARRRK